MIAARVTLLLLGAALLSGGTPAPDLAALAAGDYRGDIISDARGSSRSDIAITVARSGANEVMVTCRCDRLPVRKFRLTRAMDTIQNVGGTEVFLLDLAKAPRRLDLTIDDASWSGEPAT